MNWTVRFLGVSPFIRKILHIQNGGLSFRGPRGRPLLALLDLQYILMASPSYAEAASCPNIEVTAYISV